MYSRYFVIDIDLSKFDFYFILRTKAFAAQRRAVKPTRRHAASKNPVKVLQDRSSGLFEDDDDDEEDDEEENKENEDRFDSSVKENGADSERRDRFGSQVILFVKYCAGGLVWWLKCLLYLV